MSLSRILAVVPAFLYPTTRDRKSLASTGRRLSELPTPRGSKQLAGTAALRCRSRQIQVLRRSPSEQVPLAMQFLPDSALLGGTDAAAAYSPLPTCD